MLQEMRRAVGLVGLESRPGVDPNPDGGGLRGQVRFGGDAETVGQGGYAGLRSGEDPSVVR